MHNPVVLMGDDTRINMIKSTIKNEQHLLIIDGQAKLAMSNKKETADHWKTIPKDSPLAD